ncbi:hypothetical protein AQY21_10150 [Paracoccus sp. MKU1]|nr:hypothetical protein AQY21_10150 [Paracoccus sp. MKU1]
MRTTNGACRVSAAFGQAWQAHPPISWHAARKEAEEVPVSREGARHFLTYRQRPGLSPGFHGADRIVMSAGRGMSRDGPRYP